MRLGIWIRHLRDDAQRGAYREHGHRQTQVAGGCDGHEGEQRRYHDHVVQDRAYRRRQEDPVRVQYAGQQRAGAVDEYLHGEEPEHVDSPARGSACCRRNLGEHERLRPYRPEQRDGAQRDHREEEGRAGEVPGVLLTELGAALHEDRDEDRGQDSARHQLVDHVRDVVGHHVRAGQERRAPRAKAWAQRRTKPVTLDSAARNTPPVSLYSCH